MTLLLAIGVGLLGVAAVVLIGTAAGDAVGAVLVIGALVTIIRSVIRRAGEAGTGTEPAGPTSASSPEATFRFR